MTLRFQCQPQCTKCCEQRGFVYLTEEDVERIAAYLGMPARRFERRYLYRTSRLRRLRVPQRQRCPFLLPNEGCSIHEVKPVQCRAFPFWPDFVDDRAEWRKLGTWCPGVGKGELVQIATAREVAQQMRSAYPEMYRPAPSE